VTARHGDAVPRPAPDVSMTLLNEVYRRPLDPGYAAAAERVRAGTQPPRTRRGTVGLVVVAVALGAGTVTAALSLRTPPTAVTAARNLLERQIEQRTSEADDLEREIDTLNDDIRALQADALGDADPALAQEIAAGQVAAGLVPVTGPGLRIVLTDAQTDPAEEEDPLSRVQDGDLQVLVNGLWAVGAEAVAINGERLIATSAIRSAGSAVWVDFVPLVSPYTVEAIGDAVAMQTELARSPAGQLLATLRSSYDIGVTWSSQPELELGGAGQVTLRSATVPEESSLLTPSPTEGPADDESAAVEEGATDAAGMAGSARRSGRDGT
jgi:uncharacterized protein YlxW (UPF0749 family)